MRFIPTVRLWLLVITLLIMSVTSSQKQDLSTVWRLIFDSWSIGLALCAGGFFGLLFMKKQHVVDCMMIASRLRHYAKGGTRYQSLDGDIIFVERNFRWQKGYYFSMVYCNFTEHGGVITKKTIFTGGWWNANVYIELVDDSTKRSASSDEMVGIMLDLDEMRTCDE